MPRRFRDAGQSIFSFDDTFLVRCSRCERQAEVVPLPVAPAPRSESRTVGLVASSSERRAKAEPMPFGSESRSGRAGLFAPRRCVCAHCGFVKEWQGKKVSVGAACDWYFGYPLWLQTPCCGQTLWAFNEPHLRFLEEFVGADLREREPRLRHSTSLTYAARLPRWVQLGANRDEVMRGLARLRALLDE